jgi:hypothetical protein
VTAVRAIPVSVWVTLISTPGKTAPLVSDAIPLICAVALVCACNNGQVAMKAAKPIPIDRRTRRIDLLLIRLMLCRKSQ